MSTTTMTRPRVLSATSLIGDEVRNAQGENLGELKELMIDLEQGRIAYAVLSFGGFLGMGDKLFAIPFSSFTVAPDEHKMVLDVPKERLEQAPGFDKNNWPQVGDRTWGEEIHRYYGQRPYWETV